MINKENLQHIYKGFNKNQAIGVDGTSKSVFDKNIDNEIDTIIRKISNVLMIFHTTNKNLL
jgi:hypothetical protein